MVTIAEIARRAGVSKATVSRALNGRPDVDGRTADRIRVLVAALGYVPSASARALAHGRGRCIGLLVPSLDLPWLLELLRGVADAVEAADHTLALHTVASGEASLATFLAQVDARVIDGLVAVVPRELPSLLRLRQRGLPIVLIDDRGQAPGFPSVWSTDRLGGAQATRHLLALGRRPVAMVTGPGLSRCTGDRDRFEGYRDALAEAGLPVAPGLVAEGDWTVEGGAAAAAKLLAARPDLDAIFAANDLMAFGAMRTLARAGRRVPDDVAVVGYDDIPAAALAVPSLTTVRQPLHEMGRRAAARLLAALSGEQPSLHPEALPTTLVVRDSCGASDRDLGPTPGVDWKGGAAAKAGDNL